MLFLSNKSVSLLARIAVLSLPMLQMIGGLPGMLLVPTPRQPQIAAERMFTTKYRNYLVASHAARFPDGEEVVPLVYATGGVQCQPLCRNRQFGTCS